EAEEMKREIMDFVETWSEWFPSLSAEEKRDVVIALGVMMEDRAYVSPVLEPRIFYENAILPVLSDEEVIIAIQAAELLYESRTPDQWIYDTRLMQRHLGWPDASGFEDFSFSAGQLHAAIAKIEQRLSELGEISEQREQILTYFRKGLFDVEKGPNLQRERNLSPGFK
ncbi:MAG: hypothetical protein AAF202_06265, partial [Pseudomonadota bacterium]